MSYEEKKELLYMQLRDKILTEYQHKPYYAPLPGERELCDVYSVSRPTVRKALEILEEQGKIIRLAGKGAFFVGNKEFIEANSNKMQPTNIAFYDQVSLRGDYTRSKVLTEKIEMASYEIAARMKTKMHSKVFHLERLRYINDKLYSLANSYILYDLCPELKEYDFSDRSLHKTLSEHGHVPYKADKTIEISKATEYESLHLNIETGSPITITSSIIYNKKGNILEYSISKSDAYKTLIKMDVFNKQPNKGY